MNSSHMMIEISDVDVKDPLGRANTVTGKMENKKPGNDYTINFSVPVTGG